MSSLDDYTLLSSGFITIRLDEPFTKILNIDRSAIIVLISGPNQFYVFGSQELTDQINKSDFPYTNIEDIKLEQILKLSNDQISSVFDTSGKKLSAPSLKTKSHPSTMRAVVLKDDSVDAIGLEPDSELGRLESFNADFEYKSLPKLYQMANIDQMISNQKDEGTDIRRYPSIASDKPVQSGSEITITVDLLRNNSDQSTDSITDMRIRNLPTDWEKIAIDVELICNRIEFENTKSTIFICRNKASEPALFKGKVEAGLADKEMVKVVATFSYANRTCGIANRVFTVGTTLPIEPVEKQIGNIIALETATKAPKLRVNIFNPEASSASGKLYWSIQIEKPDEIPDLPANLTGIIDLGSNAKSEFTMLFRKLAQKTPGMHMDGFNSVGERIWDKTPDFFKQAYWALLEKFGSNFPIQFITNDLYTPWELMRPYQAGLLSRPEILALTHPVARWITDFEGFLSGSITKGKTVTIAPEYNNGQDELPYAQEESSLLQKKYNATRIDPAKREEIMSLLKCNQDFGPVSIVHFAGHGKFNADLADESVIELEDCSLSADEISTQEVMLGEKYGTIVFLNACEIGQVGSFIGTAGGWASAFLRRKFKGFIAPLFKVNDANAAQVTDEIFDAVLKNHVTISNAILDMRKKHGKESPTYLSYLYYGDVMAEISSDNS